MHTELLILLAAQAISSYLSTATLHAANGTKFATNSPAAFLMYAAKYASKGAPVMIERTPDGLVFSELVCIDMGTVAAAPLGAAALSMRG